MFSILGVEVVWGFQLLVESFEFMEFIVKDDEVVFRFGFEIGVVKVDWFVLMTMS